MLLNVPDDRIRCHVGDRPSFRDPLAEIGRRDIQLGNHELGDPFGSAGNRGFQPSQIEGRVARPVHRDDLAEIRKTGGLAPDWQIGQRVTADDEEQSRVGSELPLKHRHRLDAVGRARAVYVDPGQPKAGIVGDRQSNHLDAIGRGRDRLTSLVGRVAGRHEENHVQTELPPAIRGDHQVAVVNRIEGPTQDADLSLAHETHSSSTGPKRTTSPACTPIFSNAALTPSFFNCRWR